MVRKLLAILEEDIDENVLSKLLDWFRILRMEYQKQSRSNSK